jgi:hypothetical protein
MDRSARDPDDVVLAGVALAAVGGVGPDASALMTIVVGVVESIMARRLVSAAFLGQALPYPPRRRP